MQIKGIKRNVWLNLTYLAQEMLGCWLLFPLNFQLLLQSEQPPGAAARASLCQETTDYWAV